MSNQAIISKVALPYAEALLESAKDNQLVDHTNQDLSFIASLLSSSSELQSLLDNPVVPPITKKNVLRNLLVNQVNPHVLKFLLLLVDRRRIILLNSIIHKYLELIYKLNSITVAEVRTSIALTEDQQLRLAEKLKNITGSKEIELMISIDANLIGGFVVKIGSKVIDTSLSNKLKSMSFHLQQNSN